MAIELTKEQKLAVQKTDGRICVAAGAGSGKTRVLVERIIALLEAKKATPRQLLAVTFTNKAAGEMKERLRSQVEEKMRQASLSIDRQFWEAILDELPMAIIGTIHGFCSRVLRTHPVESGRDPSFRVADEAEATLLVQQAVNNVLEKALRDKEPEIMQLCAAFKLRIVHTQLMSLWREKNRLPLMSPAFGEWSYIDEPQLTTSVSEAWARLLVSATTAKQKEGLEQAEQQLPPVSTLIDALWREEATAAAMLGRIKPITASGKIKEPLQTLRSLLETVRSVWAEKKTGKFNQTFFQLLSRVRENVRKRQLGENILFFDDLEQEAIRLLADYPEVRRRWQDRFAYIMVDEFQDTNKSQLTLLNFLDDGCKNGNFFFVGDEKQSIYRFRGARVEVFRKERDDLPQERQLQLVKNFRSEPAVLTDVNVFFENLYRAMGQFDFMALDAGRIDNGVTTATRFYLTEETETGRQAEAHWIAGQLKQLVAGQMVYEGDRPINYGDCALLFRSGLRMSLFAEQLRAAGVPCTIVGGSGFYDCQEVQDMLMLLGVLDNRLRELELVGVLRSPLFGLTDETILLLTQNGSLWDALLSAEELNWLAGNQRELVFRAKRILSNLHQAIRWLSPQQLAEQILTETEAATWLASGEKGPETLANVDKLFAKMIQYCQNSGAGIGEFLAYVEACRSVNIREASVQTDSSESVQLMTIHKAKGLEFAIVVLPEMDAHFPTKLPDVLVSDDGIMGFSTQVGGEATSTLTQQRLAQQYRQDEKEEAARVLYVAMTRAKERLLLTGQCPKNITENYQEKAKEKTIDETSSWLDWLLAFWPQPLGKQETSEADSASMTTSVHREAEGVCDRQTDFPLALPMLSERPAIIELSATALHTYCLCPRWFYYQYRAGMAELRSEEAGGGDGGADARELGLLAHKTLELAAKGHDVASAISEALRIMPEAAAHERLVGDMSIRFLDTDYGHQLIQGRVMTETPFVFELPLFENCRARFRGFIDYLVKNEDDQYNVLDYKTNLLTNECGLKKASAYEHQLMLYTLAVEADYGPVAQTCLYFMRSGELVKVDVHQERERLVDEILAAGRAIADRRTERDFAVDQTHCRICPFNGFCRRS